MGHPVAALFARRDSVYKSLGYVDVWDEERDARRWPGGVPAVAHPPCRAWGRLRKFAKPRDDEMTLALLAVVFVRRWGGVVEHPEGSRLWKACGLPTPGTKVDDFGGFTLEVDQADWGHRARKRTWLYVCRPTRVPKRPPMGAPSATVQSMGEREREATPEAFARWLCLLAMSCLPLEV